MEKGIGRTYNMYENDVYKILVAKLIGRVQLVKLCAHRRIILKRRL
jgi:hypothetical protein